MSAYRTTEQVSRLLFNLHEAAQSTPPERFPSAALALLPGIFPITSAWWGLNANWHIHASGSLNLPADHLKQWEVRKDDDVLTREALANPNSTIVFDGMASGAHQNLKAWMHEYGLSQAMCATCPHAMTGAVTFLSAYRDDAPFSLEEQQILKMLVPHFSLALDISWRRHVDGGGRKRTPAAMSSGLLGRNGVLHLVDSTFRDLVRAEYPAWEPPLLPGSWMARIAAGGRFSGKHIRIEARPFNEMLFVTVSRLGDLDRLSPRERDVARAFADGLSHKHIAEMFGLSPATVRNYIGIVYAKLGISSKAQLAQKVARAALH